jgi:hypothetical protein
MCSCSSNFSSNRIVQYITLDELKSDSKNGTYKNAKQSPYEVDAISLKICKHDDLLYVG